MKVRVRLFAQLKDVFGTDERIMEVRNGITIKELVQSLMSESGSGDWKSLPLRYAVNEAFEDGNRELRHNDVLALLPPVGGG